MTVTIETNNLNNGIIEQFTEGGQFSWSVLGRAVGTIITTPAPVNTMFGQCQKEDKVSTLCC
jgi:hypothetical protein